MAFLFAGGACAQELLSVYNGAATPFGTAAGQTGGFNGSFQPSLPLYHVGGRGEGGFDLVWKFQPNWQAWKQFAGSAPPDVSIDPYPSNNIAPGASGTFGLGIAGGVYARTGAGYTACPNGTYYAGLSAPSTTLTQLVFVTATGAEINLQDTATGGAVYNVPNPCSGFWPTENAGRGVTFVSQDGSTLQFTADSAVLETNPSNGTSRGSAQVSGYLRFPSGTVYRIDSSAVTCIKDRNGNRTNFAYTQASGDSVYLNWFLSAWAPTQITDPLNRTINVNYSDSSCGGCTSITYPGANGVSQEIKITTTALANALRSGCTLQTIAGLFPGTNQPTSYNYNPTVASKISLPDGSFYTFLYNSYGELARVVLRTGGAIEFDYGDANNNVNDGGGSTGDGFVGSATDSNPVMVYRRLLARREYANGSALSSTTTFVVSSSGSGSTGLTTEVDTVTDPALGVLTQTKHWYNGVPTDALNVGGTGCNGFNEGFEYETYYGSATSPLVKVANTLTPQSSSCLNNPTVQSVTTTNNTGQVSQVGFVYDGYNNITDKKEYDWGSGAPGALLRETKNTYETASAYVALNLVRLPTETKVLDGSGTLYSDTTYSYDQYGTTGITNCPNIVGHDNQNYAGGGTRGNASFISRYLNTNASWLTTTLTYDIAGNITGISDPNGHATGLTYTDEYPTGAENTYAHVTKLTNAKGQSVSWTWDYGAGTPLSATNLNQGVTTYAYDELSRLTETILPNGGTLNYVYPSTTETDLYQDQNTPGDRTLRTQTLSDGFGRAWQSNTYESATQYIQTTLTYDALGRVETTTNPSRQNPADGLGYATTYGYDSLSRLNSVITPDSQTAATSYSGNTVTAADQAGHARTSTIDGIGRLSQVVEDPGNLNYITSYTSDPLGNVRSVTQGSQTRTFVYDTLNRLTSAANPESGNVSYTYTYDGVGNPLTKTDPRGIVTTYTWDALNRPLTVSYTGGTLPVT